MVLEMSPNLLQAPFANVHDQPLLDHQVPQEVALQQPHWAASRVEREQFRRCFFEICILTYLTNRILWLVLTPLELSMLLRGEHPRG